MDGNGLAEDQLSQVKVLELYNGGSIAITNGEFSCLAFREQVHILLP